MAGFKSVRSEVPVVSHPPEEHASPGPSSRRSTPIHHEMLSLTTKVMAAASKRANGSFGSGRRHLVMGERRLAAREIRALGPRAIRGRGGLGQRLLAG